MQRNIKGKQKGECKNGKCNKDNQKGVCVLWKSFQGRRKGRDRLRWYHTFQVWPDLEQAQREEVMYEFKAGRINILVATDIVARGIDIDDIRLVINYDVPHDSEDYVHRIGRTARANNDGVALTFVNEKEQTNFKGIENFLEKEIYKIPVPEELGEAPEYKPRSNDGRKRSYKGGGRRNAGSGKGGNRNNSRRREGRPSSGTKKQE